MQREVLSALLPGGVLRSTVLQVILAAEAVFALYMLLGTLMGGLSPKVFEDVLKLRGVKEVSGSGSRLRLQAHCKLNAQLVSVRSLSRRCCCLRASG